MPTLNNVEVIDSELVWETDDGLRKLYKITMELDGKKFQAKTWSAAISKVGWKGDIETYEKTGKMGPETFVKQPQKEGFGGGGFQKSGGFKAAAPKGDSFTMYLSYAKDIAIALIEDGKLDDDKYGKALSMVLDGGKTLYEGRPDAPAAPEKKEEPVESRSGQSKEDLEELNKLFGEIGV